MRQKILTFKRTLLFLLLVAIIGSGIAVSQFFGMRRDSVEGEVPTHFVLNPTDKPKTVPAVLGTGDGHLLFSSAQNGESNGGVLVLSAKEAAQIRLLSGSISGTGSFSLYKVGINDLLTYLRYKRVEDSSTIDKVFVVDESTLTGKQTFQKELSTMRIGYQTVTELQLPIEGTGIWFLRGTVSGKTVETMLVRSNIGAIIHGGDNENIFWAQSTDYGSLSGVKIDIYNAENTLTKLDTLTTDANGIATNAVSDASDFAIATNGEDVTLLPINLTNLLYRSGGKYSWYSSFSKREVSNATFMFTDRFLYKPGDTVYFKAILREDDDADYRIAPRVVSGIFRGYDSSTQADSVIWQKSLAVSDIGTVDGSFVIPKDARPAHYNLAIKDGEEHLYSMMLQVAPFRKPDSTVSVSTDKLSYVPAETLTAMVSGETFFGQPISDAVIRYKVYSSKAYVTGDYEQLKYTQYIESFDPSERPILEGSITLDRTGVGNIKLPVTNTTGIRQFWAIHIEYIDSSGNSTTDAVQALIHPADFSIEAIRPVPEVLVGKETQYPLRLLRNRSGAKIDGIDIRAELFIQRRGEYFLEQKDLRAKSDSEGKFSISITPKEAIGYRLHLKANDVSGNLSLDDESIYVREVPRDRPVDLFTIETNKRVYEVGDIARVTIRTRPEIQNIFVSLGRAYSREYRVLPVNNGVATFETEIKEKYQPNFFFDIGSFSKDVWIHEQQKIQVNTDDKKVQVTITPSKTAYGPGETARFDIQASTVKGQPVQTDLAFWIFDKALLELHGNYFEGIFNQFWRERYFSIPTNFSYQGILNMGAEQGGGCFTADTPITLADGSTRRIAQIKAGDMIRTFSSVDTKKTTAAVVSGTHKVTVDGVLVVNGTLQLTAEHKLYVNKAWKTAGEIQIGDVLLSSKGTAVPVTSLEWIRGKMDVYNLTVEKFHTFFADGIYVHNDKGGTRSVFKDTAYWNPHVQTDENGKATLSVKLPDNLTTWITAAVSANARTQVGDGKNEFRVTKDIVAIPILPQFFRIGDMLQLSALLRNYTESDHTFSVTGSFTNATLANATQKVDIAPKGFAQVVWPLTVPTIQGEAQFQVKSRDTTNENLGDDIVVKLPVFEYGSWMTKYQRQQNTASFTLRTSAGTDPVRASGSLRLSAYRYPELQTLLTDLSRRGYGVDDSAATLMAAGMLRMYGPELGLTYNQTNLNTTVAESLKMLKAQQKGGVWGNQRAQYNASLTRQVIEALASAKRAGFAIDDGMLTTALTYVTNHAPVGESELIEQQYVYSLFPEHTLDRKKLNVKEITEASAIARAVIANSRQGFVNSTDEESRLLSGVRETPTQYSWYSCSRAGSPGWDCIAVPTTWSARAMTELKLNPEKIAKALDYLYRNPFYDKESKVEQALATIAYYQQARLTNPEFSYTIKLGQEILRTGTVTAKTVAIAPVTLTPAQIMSGKTIQVEQAGTGTLYSEYAQREFYADKNLPAAAHNLTIQRKYFTKKTDPKQPLAPGDLVIVELSVKGFGRGERAVEIEDYLPSGLIPIDTRLDNGNFDSSGGVDASQEITSQGMKLTFAAERGDTEVVRYKTRVVTAGVYTIPPAVVRLQHDPSIWAQTGAGVLAVDGKTTLENRSDEVSYAKESAPLQVDEHTEPGKVFVGKYGGIVLILVLLSIVLYRRKNQLYMLVWRARRAIFPEKPIDDR